MEKIKVYVTGTRGVPTIPGGVETHCQELYPKLDPEQFDVTVVRRANYVPDAELGVENWRGLHLIDIYSPLSKSFEAIIHTFLALIEAKKNNADIAHIHAIGPGLMVPFAKLLKLKVVFTHHGADYKRQKWGLAAKTMLRLGEYFACRFSDRNIVISQGIFDSLSSRDQEKTDIVYNGMSLDESAIADESLLASFGLEKHNYIVAIGRLVPEKGFHDLVDAYRTLNLPGKLVIVGDSDHESDYSVKLLETIASDENVVATGYLTGDKLKSVFTFARVFVLPSYHEGLPIALLESVGNKVYPLVSDIEPNLEVGLDPEHYFKCGDIVDLSNSLQHSWSSDSKSEKMASLLVKFRAKYSWHKIAGSTAKIYYEVIGRCEK